MPWCVAWGFWRVLVPLLPTALQWGIDSTCPKTIDGMSPLPCWPAAATPSTADCRRLGLLKSVCPPLPASLQQHAASQLLARWDG